MMYAMPGVFAVSGVNFPIGVLIYWLTTNVWSMGQQFIVIRRMPAPGSEAEKRMLERKAKKHPKKVEEDTAVVIEVEAPKGQRVQPKKTTRSQRRSGPLQASNPSPATPGPLDEAEPQDGHTAEEPTGGAEATPGAGAGIPSDGAEKASGQRNQPKSTSRKKRKK
jgi:YidC/Oxa1 family membrane protein insertase